MKGSPLLRLTIAQNNHFLCYTYILFYQIFWRNWEKEEQALWIPGKKDWLLAGIRGITDECQCGSDYRTENGSEFKRAIPNLSLEKLDAIIDAFHSPALCEECFYRKEYSNPSKQHLVPTRWQEKFSQNS